MTEQTAIAHILKRQRSSFLADDFPCARLRQDRLARAIDLLKSNKSALCQSMHEDFGARAFFQSSVSDILIAVENLKYCHKHTASWMRTENRGAKFPLNLFGAKAQVFYQPKGVVGIISPWNFPVLLTFSPLANVLSAGNRAMIKPSEHSPATSALIKTLIEKYYSPEEVAVVTGGAQTGIAFTEQAFDHLLFTGAPSVARHVACAAAENLVPLTLELGGKCPVIISEKTSLLNAVNNLMTVKVLNAGQICLAPDYVFIKENKVTEFVNYAQQFIRASFPRFNDNDDYTAIINERHYARLQHYIDQARAANCQVIELASACGDTPCKESKKLIPTLIVNPDDHLSVMQHEIFGPVLPIKTYSTMADVIDYINQRPRPLALYYFGKNQQDIRQLKEKTTSGGLVINDVATHVIHDTMPLGGVGYSGMGAYRGIDGFREFSHARAYFKQGLLSLTSLFKPPFKQSTLHVIEKMIG